MSSTKNDALTQGPEPADEIGRMIKREFKEVTDQEILPPDPLAALAALLQTHSKPLLDKEIEKQMDNLINVTTENESLMEIKDILDELNSVTHVFKQQIKLLEAIVSGFSLRAPSPTDGTPGPNALPKASTTATVEPSLAEDIPGPSASLNTPAAATFDADAQGLLEQNQPVALPSTWLQGGDDLPDRYIKLLATLQRRAHDFEDLTTEAMRVYNAV
jgi:hypothetical protein